ncbi:hypothetical protein UES1_072 [Escherichia phage UE-S1]|nr:hypothetical protein UES1_072 [Escherichia phage UE-S1]
MNVDEIKKHFEIALSCNFDTKSVVSPKEYIHISSSYSHSCIVHIEKTYDRTELSFYNPLIRTTSVMLIYNTISDIIEIISTYTDVTCTTIYNASTCITEEGYFQESLIQNFNYDYKDLSYIVLSFEKINEMVLSLFDIIEQNPKVIKC